MRSYQASRSSVSSQRNNRTRYGTQGSEIFGEIFHCRPEWNIALPAPSSPRGCSQPWGNLAIIGDACTTCLAYVPSLLPCSSELADQQHQRLIYLQPSRVPRMRPYSEHHKAPTMLTEQHVVCIRSLARSSMPQPQLASPPCSPPLRATNCMQAHSHYSSSTRLKGTPPPPPPPTATAAQQLRTVDSVGLYNMLPRPHTYRRLRLLCRPLSLDHPPGPFSAASPTSCSSPRGLQDNNPPCSML